MAEGDELETDLDAFLKDLDEKEAKTPPKDAGEAQHRVANAGVTAVHFQEGSQETAEAAALTAKKQREAAAGNKH